jgi:type VI secretion system secreted protein Hcp
MAIVLKLIDRRGNPIKGESKVPGHVDEIDIQAWGWGVTAPAGARLNFLDISIKKLVDLASPVLLGKAATHEILQQGVLTVIDQQGTRPDFLVLTLKKIAVESITIAEGQFPPVEEIALRFDEIEFNCKGEHVILIRSQAAAPRKRKG